MSTLHALAARAARAPRAASGDARRLAALHVLDTMGCAVSGATHPIAASAARHFGDSLRSRVLRWSAQAHLDEFDALHAEAAVVPAAVVVPAALLVAEHEGRPGSAVVDAVLAGYEAVVEAGLRFGGASLYGSGWWPTALFGPLGAAAATSVLLDLDEERAVAALAIAAAGLGGLLSTGSFGEAHYLLPGRAAADGVEAAYLARAGATGSPALLDGPATLALGRPPSPASPLEGVHLARCGFKPYACARPLHAVIDALLALDVRDAAHVEVALPSGLMSFVNSDREVPGPAEASAGAAFAVAAVLSGAPEDVSTFRRARLPAGVPPTTLVPDPELDALLPGHWAARVTIETPSGRSSHCVVDALGSPAHPLPPDAVLKKFDTLTAGRLTAWRARCLTLDDLDSAAELTRPIT
ncbi:MmgE/PrpD family protein [Actinomadura madurae]|uniref:MmgE/PrpD family protein n=1 Tax=Actinomadura madurae TaxID=1993 RepID=UPI002026B337|nr:MmgE/PrpD family protein [Actinomadura madurae]URN00987.1 MmgE/PrpD family protein [Actinomadura madurae]